MGPCEKKRGAAGEEALAESIFFDSLGKERSSRCQLGPFYVRQRPLVPTMSEEKEFRKKKEETQLPLGQIGNVLRSKSKKNPILTYPGQSEKTTGRKEEYDPMDVTSYKKLVSSAEDIINHSNPGGGERVGIRGRGDLEQMSDMQTTDRRHTPRMKGIERFKVGQTDELGSPSGRGAQTFLWKDVFPF